MNALELLSDVESHGATVQVEGDMLALDMPIDFPENLVEGLRECKVEVLRHLRLRDTAFRYRRERPCHRQDESELVEIVRRVWDEGVCLVWARALGDFVAFYRSEADLPKIPPGFVPYSDAELLHLFGQGQPVVSLSTLRLIHAAKKTGARITGVEPDTAPGV